VDDATQLDLVTTDKERIALITDLHKQTAILWCIPEAIKYLRSPTPEQQLAALGPNEGQYIRWIKNPTEEAQLISVNTNGRNLKFIPGASEKVKLAGVTQNGFALKYLANPSNEVIVQALKNNGNALQFVARPTAEQIKVAVHTSGAQVTKLQKMKVPAFKDAYGEDSEDLPVEIERPEFDAADEDNFWNKMLKDFPKVTRGGNRR
jgi:hypothetical protein